MSGWSDAGGDELNILFSVDLGGERKSEEGGRPQPPFSRPFFRSCSRGEVALSRFERPHPIVSLRTDFIERGVGAGTARRRTLSSLHPEITGGITRPITPHNYTEFITTSALKPNNPLPPRIRE